MAWLTPGEEEKQGEKDEGKEGEKGRINEIEILFKDGKQI